ncbi:hypothetical protein LJR220_003332 [Bradyrhizobium sp. LjRoot220]|uniref:hypothetical protein n=1 Tax=Bradyrhizobium sp. LjRoot220 TaxID=3342284 RepID=UPI003ED0637A
MRRSSKVEIPAGDTNNRDAGKTFIITEVSAVQAEEWALRALMALGTSGIVVPQETADAGLIGVALIGYQAFMGAKQDEVLPLWREMLPACVTMRVSQDVSHPWNPTLIEEVSTLLKLREQILELHTGFTLAELTLRLREVGSAGPKKRRSRNTSTSPAPSGP